MPRGHAGSSAVAIVALACLLLASTASSSLAQGSDIEALWKEKLKRPTHPPSAPPDNPLTPDKVGAGSEALQSTRACPATASAPARRAIGRTRPSPTAAGGRWPLRSLLATQHARAVEPGVGQAFLLGRTRLLARGAGRHADRGGREMGGDWPTILRRLGEDADLAGQFRAAFAGGAARYRRRPSSRRSQPTCARSSRRRPDSMPGSRATRRR